MATLIDETLKMAGSGVVLFSKSYCPYCRRAKQALKSIGITPVTIELDEHEDGRSIQAALLARSEDGRSIQAALLARSGQRTVPSAWLAGTHIGGSDDVVDGVRSGLFKNAGTRTRRALETAEDAGLKPCAKGDGFPCLCHEKY